MGNHTSVYTWILPHLVGPHGEAITITVHHNNWTGAKVIKVNGVERGRFSGTLKDALDISAPPVGVNIEIICEDDELEYIQIFFYRPENEYRHYQCFHGERLIRELNRVDETKSSSLIKSVKGKIDF